MLKGGVSKEGCELVFDYSEIKGAEHTWDVESLRDTTFLKEFNFVKLKKGG